MRMKGKKYNLLVHYKYPQIKKGYEVIVNALSLPTSIIYTQLDEDGILFKLRFDPHLIIILMGEGDSDYDLSFKIKLFAPHIPIIVITPQVPASFHEYLLQNGVGRVIQLPMNEEEIRNVIMDIIL